MEAAHAHNDNHADIGHEHAKNNNPNHANNYEETRSIRQLNNFVVDYDPYGFYNTHINFELKSSILNVIPKIYGRDGEDPYQHLFDLYEAISPFTPSNTNLDEVLRHSFHFSVQGDDKEWLKTFP
ncbi:hypothetical protein K1719_031452 [Acacia pycnantha]|nr:hypothetical protein K1719_031452 [Acacia pycnantha]